MAILQISWPILKVSWPILVATCRQLCPSFANLRPNFARNFHHIAPCTRRNDPRASTIGPAFNLPRFSILPELHFHRFWLLEIHFSSSSPLKYNPHRSSVLIFSGLFISVVKTKTRSPNTKQVVGNRVFKILRHHFR